jgi:hypothetical protein
MTRPEPFFASAFCFGRLALLFSSLPGMTVGCILRTHRVMHTVKIVYWGLGWASSEMHVPISGRIYLYHKSSNVSFNVFKTVILR